MAGASCRRGLVMCTWPRLVGLAHAGGELGKAVPRLAKGVQAERLHVVFNIGPRLGRVAAGEGTELARVLSVVAPCILNTVRVKLKYDRYFSGWPQPKKVLDLQLR